MRVKVNQILRKTGYGLPPLTPSPYTLTLKTRLKFFWLKPSKKTAFLALLLLFFPLSLQICMASEAHLGFLYDRYHLTLTPGERTEVLGPFFGYEKNAPGQSLF